MSCCGSKQTTVSSNTATNQGQQFSLGSNLQSGFGSSYVGPNTSPQFQAFQAAIPGQYASILSQLRSLGGQSPYGPAQQANFQQGVNRQLEAAQKNATSQLAASGALNSARAGQVQTGIQLGGAQEMGNYLAQVPALNTAFQQGLLGNEAQLVQNAGAFRPLVGTTSQGTNIMQALQSMFGSSMSNSQQQGSQTTETSQNPLGAVLGGLLNAGLGFLSGGLSNVLGGGSFLGGGGDSGSAPQSYSWGGQAGPQWSSPYSAGLAPPPSLSAGAFPPIQNAINPFAGIGGGY